MRGKTQSLLWSATFSTKTGVCRLCGRTAELTFEHTPPRAAYNDRPAVLGTFDDWERGYGSEYQKEGRGGRVLCGPCNHSTGGAYGPAFVDWSRLGLERIHQTKDRKSLNFHGAIYPLRVLKQIATIFFATTSTGFRTKHPDLEKFVLDYWAKGLPPNYHFYVFWYGGGSLRQTGVTGVMNTEDGSVNVAAEFVHPPFGYVLSLEGKLRDRRPELISDFANFEYDEAVTINRRLPVLETHWLMTGDYRTKEEILRDRLVNELTSAGVPNARELIHQMERG